jgi:hypothetical protein
LRLRVASPPPTCAGEQNLLKLIRRIVRGGERMVDTWESFFREKSRRRSRRRSIEKARKAGVLTLLLGSIAMAAYLLAAGVPM